MVAKKKQNDYAEILTKLFITAFMGSDFATPILFRILAFITTLCLTIISAFNLPSKTSNYITAWRLLNKTVYSYKAKISDMETLIKAYEEGEKLLDSVDFRYTKIKLPSKLDD